MDGMGPALHAVIAVKRLDRAKSRLAAEFPGTQRSALVLAMLDDTLTAALAVPAVATVTVVTPDAAVADLAAGRGAIVHPEPEASGLNAALGAAFITLRREHGPVDLLALQADLPALRSAELTEALAAAPAGRRSVVADHQRTGTAALIVRDGSATEPLFGPDSARRHVAAGALELTGDWPGLRLDVDTRADLARALELGAGPATSRFLTPAV